MKLPTFAYATLVTALIAASGLAYARPTNLPPIEFLNAAKCNADASSLPVCQDFPGTFEDWDQVSQAKVQTAIDLIPSGKFERVIDVLRQSGLKKISLVRKSDGKTMAGTSVDGDTAYIELDRDFFITSLSYSGVSEQTHALIHEMMHVFIHYKVGNDFFSDPFWTDLKTALEWNYPKRVNALVNEKAWSQHWKMRNQLKMEDQPEQAVAEDLNYARGLGFPSLYGMSQIEEYFAELGSFLVHDETMQKAPPAKVVNWFLKTDLAFLFDSQTPIPEVTQMADRHVDVDDQFDFVGMLFLNDAPICTVTILQHGFAVLARHCLDPSWFKGATAGTKFMFLNLQFHLAKGDSIRISGMDLIQIQGDTGDDDLAYIRYPAEETMHSIQLPIFDLVKDKSLPPASTIFTVGYPMPDKIQHLERIVSGPCHLDGRIGRLSGYQGELIGTTCPAWFGASGSLFFAPSPKPGHLQVLGALSHTFDIDANGQPLASALKTDAWGSYTDSNYSPIWLAGWDGVNLASVERFFARSASTDSTSGQKILWFR
jgi:hypothetical protein